jgi:hypothetical protein
MVSVTSAGKHRKVMEKNREAVPVTSTLHQCGDIVAVDGAAVD